MSAPVDWGGRAARCPACGASFVIPMEGEPGLEAPVSRARPDRLPGPSSALATEWSLDAGAVDAGRAAADPAIEVARSFERAARARSRRAWVVRGVVLFSLAAIVAGGLWWRHVYREEYSAAGRMKKRGAGVQILPGQAHPHPAAQAAMARVRSAEQAFQTSGERLDEAVALVQAYRAALALDPPIPDASAAYVRNNLAWLLATTRFVSLRDPEEAVRLAEEAVEAASGEWTYRDTLAEALAAAGRAGDAVRAAEEAIEIAPAQPWLRHQLDRFRALAGSASR